MSLPLENLDNKTFEQLVEEAKKRIPIYAPQWTDHNLHDPGITMIELFAWLAEMQIYQLNKVTEEAMWKFLKLTGIEEGSETLEQAVLQARKDMKTVTRAVTSKDYETLALHTPVVEVARVKALPRYHPNMHREVPGIVTVVVTSPGQTPPGLPDIKFYRDVYRHLSEHRLLTTELFVIPPGYVEISVGVEVVIKPEFLGKTVIESVNTGLNNFLHPFSGGSEGQGWPFGRPVYVSEIYEVIDGVEGVDYVETGTVHLKKAKEDWQKHDIHIPQHGLVYPGTHIITARED